MDSIRIRLCCMTVLCTGFLLGTIQVWADDAVSMPTPEQIAAMTAAAEKGEENGKDEDKPDFPPFDKVTKDFVKTKSADPTEETTFLTLYYNEKEDKLLAEIPKTMLGKDFLMASSVSGGSQYTGFQWDTQMVHWDRMGKKILLIAPDTRYDQNKDSPVQDVVARSFTADILATTKIMTESPAGNPVIDLGEIFKKDQTGWSGIFGYAVKPDLSKWGHFKAFPKNVELPVDTAMSRSQPGAPTTRTRLHYSLSELPQTDYKPRRADERIGYFMTVTKDWGKKYDEDTLFNRYVNRWNIQKVDPSLKLSPVKEPIVWYIEKTVPIRYRRYVKDGIMEWNKAFEKCGFLDAIQVRQQTDTEFAYLDPEDVRYNFFRWIVTGRAFAAGPSRAHPQTGEILDADVVFDDSFLRGVVGDYNAFGSGFSLVDNDPLLAEFFEKNPKWRLPGLTQHLAPESLLEFVGGSEARRWESDVLLAGHMNRKGQFACQFAHGLEDELGLAASIWQANGGDQLPDEYVGAVLKEVVTHEIGHTLGLMHNFKASTWLGFDEIIKGEPSEDRATTGSVMDYNPTIFKLHGEEHEPQFVTNAIGPYDYWAVEYGYRTVEAPLKSEEELLKSITERAGESGLEYANDLDAIFFSPDPMVNRFDCGKNPLDFVRYRVEQTNLLLKDICNWGVKDGESYGQLRRTVWRFLRQHLRAARFAGRFLGGMHFNYTYKGDPNERLPLEVVDVKLQREALKLLDEYVFADGAIEFSPELLNKLAPGRFYHWDSDQFDLFHEYPVHQMVQAIQFQALFAMINPFSLTRMYDAEQQVDPDQETMTIAELFDSVTNIIWSELDASGSGPYTTRKPCISSYRRNLQRSYLEVMVMIIVYPADMLGLPADARSIVLMTLKDLGEKIDKKLGSGKGLDAFTRAHLTESRMRIEKAIDSTLVAH